MYINENELSKLSEFYRDKEVNLIIEKLYIDFYTKDNISDEEFKFINKISLKMLRIKWNINFENIKTFILFNCMKIEANAWCYKDIENSYLWFIKNPIQLFDSKSDQRLTFEWESIKFFIFKNKIEKIKPFKTNTGNFLFIPLDVFWQISCSGFREILSVDDINKQFGDLDFQHQFKDNGFIIPAGYSNRIFVNLNDADLDCLSQYKDIIQLFKDKKIDLTIENLGILLETNKLLLDDFSSINFKYSNKRSTVISEYSISNIIDNIDLINLKFWVISKSTILSPDEFQFWWKVLGSSKTRFKLTSINLYFNLLSECLTVLSLCSDCPELESIFFRYLEADTENKDEVVEQAKRKFRHKFGFIQNMNIYKY